MKTEMIPVHYFYPFHHGTDPRFSEDGQTFHNFRYHSVFDLALIVSSYAIDLLSYCLAYLHVSSEEREVRYLFLQAADAERKLHYFTAESCIQGICRPDSYMMMEYYEHELCERLGQIASKILEIHPPHIAFSLMNFFALSTLLQRTQKALTLLDALQHQGNASIDHTLKKKFPHSKSAELIK